MIKKILLWTTGVIAVLVIGFVAVVAMQPSDFVITRSAAMAAPASEVFDQVNDFRRWQAWSPWEKLDPALKRSYAGPSAGEGATYSWVGNDEVGEGNMTITESRPSELIRIKLQFIKPFAATNTTEFKFEPEGERTTVTWSMSGKHNFMGKAFCLFRDMDAMVGGSFEEGLADLKKIVEAESKEPDESGKAISSDEVPVGNE
jgi:hypothetical protein